VGSEAVKRLVYLRHTKTAFNAEPMRLRGGLNVPLSDDGLAQIPSVVRRVKTAYPDVKRIFSSPLDRASILATTVASEYGLTVTELPELRSLDYGIFNGRVVSEVMDMLKTLTSLPGRDLSPRDGESMGDFLERIAAGVKHVTAEAPEEGCVIIVTHLQNIMISRAYLRAGMPDDVRRMPYEYRETNEVEPGTWVDLRREWVENGDKV
jgi:broad specificity phosphatase PhoE